MHLPLQVESKSSRRRREHRGQPCAKAAQTQTRRRLATRRRREAMQGKGVLQKECRIGCRRCARTLHTPLRHRLPCSRTSEAWSTRHRTSASGRRALHAKFWRFTSRNDASLSESLSCPREPCNSAIPCPPPRRALRAAACATRGSLVRASRECLSCDGPPRCAERVPRVRATTHGDSSLRILRSAACSRASTRSGRSVS